MSSSCLHGCLHLARLPACACALLEMSLTTARVPAFAAGKASGEADGGGSGSDAAVADQLKATMEELKAAQQELKAANESVAQYKAISAASEAALKDLSENMTQLTKELEERQEKYAADIQKLQQEVSMRLYVRVCVFKP